MSLRPIEDFATREEALQYANTRLDEWKEKFRELEADIASLSENPPFEEVRRTATKWQERAIVIQGVKA